MQHERGDNQGFPLVLRLQPSLWPYPHTVNHVYFVFSALRSVYEAFDRHSDAQDQRAVEAYLANAQSASELEYRERQWLRAHS